MGSAALPVSSSFKLLLLYNRFNYHQQQSPWIVRTCYAHVPRLSSFSCHLYRRRCCRVLRRVAGDEAYPSSGEVGPNTPAVGISEFDNSFSSGEEYVGLFVQMLGLENDPLDREQAVTTLWKYSEGGKSCVDTILKFPGCTRLVVSLLKSDSDYACEAAAGLLCNISAISLYRDVIAESGAIEEITALLCLSSLTPKAKEQTLCTLWNISIDEKHGTKIAKSDILYLLVKFLDHEEVKVKEAAGGILANLALSPCNHGVMVDAGVIPKLAGLLKGGAEVSKIIRKEAKSALLELAKDDYYRILITEEGLVHVPLIGAAAYKCFKPLPHSWPSLPDGTEIERVSRPSRYGASELLLGLNVRERKLELEEAKMNAMVGRSQQQFLARIGAIETEEENNSHEDSLVEKHTLLPWVDGVARLVLILGLEDITAISRAAKSIADASISEHMRIAFREAGVIRPLVQLLKHDEETVREAVTHAVEKLCISHGLCRIFEEEGILDSLINIIKNPSNSECLLEKCVIILSRILDPGKDMEVFNGLGEVLNFSGNLPKDGLANPPNASSEENVRGKIDPEIISRLTGLLKSSSPSLQVKVALIMEYAATSDKYVIAMTEAGIESALDDVLARGSLSDTEADLANQPELDAAEAEEIGLAIGAGARLLTKLLEFEHFGRSIDSRKLVHRLRRILRSDILPLQMKEWVAACLVKLESQLGPDMSLDYPIDMEVTLYEAIPRLVERMSTSLTYELREAAAVELNNIISRGSVECSKAVAAAGGIFPLVKLIEESSGDGLEASLAILYNLSMDSENHSAIISAGAVPALKRVVLSEGPQWARALRLLRSLPI